MTPNDMLASKDVIGSILLPHADLAVDLMNMMGSRSTGDPAHRFQIAALIVFLSGVDKALSLALQLMYLADRVEWWWLTRGHKLKPGVIECRQGLTAKLNKLHSLGLDLTDLQWIVDLRNEYIHTCSIYAGYRVGIGDGDTSQFILRASGPEVSFLREPWTALGPTEIQTYAEHLTERLGKFLDGIKWQVAWALLQEVQSHLPVNPEPEYSQIADASQEKIYSLTVTLNERYVGEGLRWLREKKQKE